jgi:hypothetical protein
MLLNSLRGWVKGSDAGGPTLLEPNRGHIGYLSYLHPNRFWRSIRLTAILPSRHPLSCQLPNDEGIMRGTVSLITTAIVALVVLVGGAYRARNQSIRY